MLGIVNVVRQAKARIFGGDTHVEGKIVSVFEPSTEVIRKGKASKPTEFGKMVKVQEAENQIVIDYEVYDQKPSDTELLIPAIERHEKLTGRTPDLVAADNGFFSAKNEAAAHEKGVKRVSIPNRSTKSEARRQLEKTRLGRRVLCTDHHLWSTGRIVQAFRGQWNVEELFRRAKKGGVVP